MKFLFKIILLSSFLISSLLSNTNIDECKSDLYYANGIMMKYSKEKARLIWHTKAKNLFVNNQDAFSKIGKIDIAYNILQGRLDDIFESFEQVKLYDIGDLAISTITVSELYYGVYKSQYIEKNLLAIEHFLKPFNIVEYDYKASKEYGKIRADFKKKGKVIGGLDMMICAHALSLNMSVVTNNTKEFERVLGLNIENWVN